MVAVGEIGYDEMSAAEEKYFRAQIELAKDYGLPIMVHTPHRNKKKGTSRSMDVLIEHNIPPGMAVIDHNNEETAQEVLDRGFWAAFTIYPHTKMGNERMAEVVKKYGSERVIVDSAADWGVSDPLAVPKTARLMLERGIPEDAMCGPHVMATPSRLTARAGSLTSPTGSIRCRSTNAACSRGTAFSAVAKPPRSMKGIRRMRLFELIVSC